MHLWLTLLAEGVFRRRSADGARVRRPRTGFANLDPGGLRGSTWASLGAPRQELADGQVANDLPEKRGPRTEIAAVERREARRSRWTGNLRQPEIGPTARRVTRCGGFRTSAVSALRPPHVSEGESTASLGRIGVARTRWAV